MARLVEIPGAAALLPKISNQLDVCQKALSSFLEEKREKFPRFYFIGDDDLLEILGQAQNPQVIQAHLKKIFSGIHKVTTSPDGSNCLLDRLLQFACNFAIASGIFEGIHPY